MPDTLEHEGRNFVKSEDGFRGKKAVQVAKIIELLQASPGEPLDFDDLCKQVGQNYPQDVQACAMALHMTEHVDIYKKREGGKAYFLVWVGPVNPTIASDSH
jgi:hypothetical protein